MARRLAGLLTSLAVLRTSSAAAEPWSKSRIARLPHSACAVVEMSPDGRKVRHLPHHDETGAVVTTAHSERSQHKRGVAWLRLRRRRRRDRVNLT